MQKKVEFHFSIFKSEEEGKGVMWCRLNSTTLWLHGIPRKWTHNEKKKKNEKERLCMQHERSSKKILNFISRKQILWLKKEIFTTENKIFSVTRLSKPPGES